MNRHQAAISRPRVYSKRISRVITDNGRGYVSRASRAACAQLGIRHIRTRPYTPKTSGKVERFVQTSLRECAYARPYESARRPCSHSLTATTGADHTPRSATNLPSHESQA